MTIVYSLLYHTQKIVSPQIENSMMEKTIMVPVVDGIRCLDFLTPHLLCLVCNSN